MHDEAISRQTQNRTLKIHHIISGLPVTIRQNNRESDPHNNQQIYQEEKNMITRLKWAVGTPDTSQRRVVIVAAASREWLEPLQGEGVEPIKVTVKKLFNMAISAYWSVPFSQNMGEKKSQLDKGKQRKIALSNKVGNII